MPALKLFRRAEDRPTPKERLAALRARLARLTRKPDGADPQRRAMLGQAALAGSLAAGGALPALASPLGERAEHRDRLLAAYAEDRAVRPIAGRAEYLSLDEAACDLVFARIGGVAYEIARLPPPRTLDGLGLAALAAAIQYEVANEPGAYEPAVELIRTVLAFTGTPLPPGFVGFGDEPDCGERDDAVYAPPGALPAWAVAQARAERPGDAEGDPDDA